MSNPYDSNTYMTFIVHQREGVPFNPKLTANGVDLKVCAASVYHENNLSARMTSLLQRILMDFDEIDYNYLNKIGFSREDASQLSMQIDGIDNINPPANWQDEI